MQYKEKEIQKMLDIKKEIEKRVAWIKNLLLQSGAKGVVFGASGGKDSVLVSLLCRMATENVTGIIMPCNSTLNLTVDREHALMIGEMFDINTVEVNLGTVKDELVKVLEPICDGQNPMAYANINPRLRMIVLYNYAQRNGYLVAGTGNRSEGVMGYFTKWGDGAYDFNPIADLTVREIYTILRYLEVPKVIIEKAPSAGLFEGQTDEKEMGLTYDEIDTYILEGKATDEVKARIDTAYEKGAHKRQLGLKYSD